MVDQRRLPDELVEVRCLTADDVTLAMKDLVVRGAPALGQVAAYGLALAAGRAAGSPPWARRTMVAGAAASLRAARPTAVNVAWAVDRMLARFAAEDGQQPDGPAVARALFEEADAIAAEATADHGRMAGLGVGLLPWFADRPTRILTHCNTGPLACGRIGTALGVVQVAHAEGRPVHVFVDETRPWLQGARLTAWELARAGVPCTILADAAAGWLLASGQVDAVLVGADRIAANGDTANKIGTYPLAVLAARHGVPFYVVAPTASIDLDAPDGSVIPIETRVADEVLSIRGRRIAPAGAQALNPVFDVTPAELVTAIVTEAGVLHDPYALSLATAVGAARSALRPPASLPAGPSGSPGAAHAGAPEP
ncbi:MAG: S-methyl-5-thioribose-1-phosphate isomerase [Chloroflexi bacterium]|nr:S-methyl-5-thioribose-1-phosphate isomerase [Chloroflexota bacterium]